MAAQLAVVVLNPTGTLSQPPGSISGAIRVTEQGEMIRFKFGLEGIAMQNLEIYTAATLEATLLPPPEPKVEWRELMNRMTDHSVKVYRQTVRENPHFVKYLRTVTPELELQMLPLGSRPAKRKVSGGIESLRAIPWVFAWTQIRLMLPAWLGTGAAINEVIADQQKQRLMKCFSNGLISKRSLICWKWYCLKPMPTLHSTTSLI